MKYEYNAESDDYPAETGVYPMFRVDVVDGQFTVPERYENDETVQAWLKEHGHAPVGSDAEEESTDGPLTGLSEDDIVGMDYDTLRSIASDLDDVDGRMSKDKIQEELILKVRTPETIDDE
jgi:hypothetical protein